MFRSDLFSIPISALDSVRHWRTNLPVEFIRLPTFERTASGLLTEADILELELFLTEQPQAGDVIQSGRGLRKLRRPRQGPGQTRWRPGHLLPCHRFPSNPADFGLRQE